MGKYLAEMFGFSLALTMAVELAVAFLFRRLWAGEFFSAKGKRAGSGGTGEALFAHSKRVWALVVLVNLLTNPLAVLLCWLGRVYLPLFLAWPVQVAVEIAVVAVEAYVYRCFAGKSGWRIGRPVAFAVTANLCSWLLGVLAMAVKGQAWFRMIGLWLKMRF